MKRSLIPFVRQVDDLGRIVLPKELRKALLIGENQPMEIRTAGNEIILRRYDVPETISCQLEEIANRTMEYSSIIGGNMTLQIVQQLAEIRTALEGTRQTKASE